MINLVAAFNILQMDDDELLYEMELLCYSWVAPLSFHILLSNLIVDIKFFEGRSADWSVLFCILKGSIHW